MREESSIFLSDQERYKIIDRLERVEGELSGHGDRERGERDRDREIDRWSDRQTP